MSRELLAEIPWARAMGALVIGLASTAPTILGTISLVKAASGMIGFKDQYETRIKIAAPPEQQLKGLMGQFPRQCPALTMVSTTPSGVSVQLTFGIMLAKHGAC